MDPSRLETLRDRLLAEQSRLEAEVERSASARTENLRAQGDISNLPTHSADRDAQDVGMHLTIEETLREELHAVVHALARTREGSYGTCEQCGKEISLERLEAIPQAVYCVDCERANEIG